MRNFRSTLVLALVVLGMAAYLFLDRHHRGTEEAERARIQVFYDAKADQINSVKITDPEGLLTLEKKGGAWTITAPIVTAADPGAVEGVLNELQFLGARRTIPLAKIPGGTKTLEGWELVPGNVVVEFSGPGFSKVLRIGRKTAVSEMLYARASNSADSPVILISSAARDGIDRKLADLRSRQALRLDPAQVRQLGLRQAGAAPEYALGRQDGAWKLEKPLSAAADTQRVLHWLGDLGSLRVQQFISDDAADLSPYGLNTPAAQFWVKEEASKNPSILLIGQPVPGQMKSDTPQVYAKRLDEKTVFTLARQDVERLAADLPATRDRRVLPFHPAEAAAIRAEQSFDPAKPAAFSARKEGDKWLAAPAAAGGKDLPVDRAALLGLVDDLAALEAAQFVSDTTSDLKAYGLDHPSATLTVTLAVAKPEAPDQSGEKAKTSPDAKKEAPAPAPAPVTLLLGKIGKGPNGKPVLYAKNAALPFIYGLDPSFREKWPGQPWTWLDTNVSPLSADQIGSITLMGANGSVLRIARTNGLYTCDRPGAIIDAGAAAGKWALLGHLHAVRWLGPAQASYGLSKPAKAIVQPAAEVKDAAPFTLLVGGKVEGGYAMQIEGAPYAFVLSEDDYKKLVANPFLGAKNPPVPAAAK
ncbi:MAG: DUF4340 domain-containing protein [Verrucomicrobium sp.]|nr:DUF4340 domain-containing protein [Verrucomicrobium sp.]